MSEKFNLKWNDFQSNASKSFRLFRNETYLHDVTLVSDDFKQIPAHKLVLSTTSEYFRNILQQTKQSQPLICLDGVNSEDLKNVLDYLYDGEVKIHQEDLDRFLTIAQKLKLEGLLNNENEDDIEEKCQLSNNENFVDEKTADYTPSRTPKSKRMTNTSAETKLIVYENGHNLSEEDHKQRLLENVQVNSDGTATCKICSKIFEGRRDRAKNNAKEHVETHIDGLIYNCSLCDKTFRSKNSLSCHRSTIHKNLF